MDHLVETKLREMLEPLAERVKRNYIEAIVLRVSVHSVLATINGAEDEDFGGVVEHALETAAPIISQFFDDLGEIKKATILSKED